MAADKPDKPARAIDAVHAGDAAPSSTSRPVIVTNRPYVTTDPMLNEISSPEQNAGEEKPSGESQDAPAPNVPKQEASPITHQVKAVAPSGEHASDSDSDEPEGVSPPQVTMEPEPEPEKPAEEAKDDEDDSETDGQITEPSRANQANNEEAARETEIEQAIIAETYFVPINRVRRHRRTVVFTLVIILLLLVVVLDILLDLGVLSLPGVWHTNFFGQ